MSKGDALDPKGLIAEAYKIENITEAECRSIFLDWALSMPLESDTRTAIAQLMDRHAVPGHPMSEVLRLGQEGLAAPRRRGGWRSRNRPQ
ncbi:hypothetical protein ACS3SW_03395 [Roseobacteraceae bacterium S113]